MSALIAERASAPVGSIAKLLGDLTNALLRLRRDALRGGALVENDADRGLGDAALARDVGDRRSTHLVDNTHNRLAFLVISRMPAADVNRFIPNGEPVLQIN